MSNIELPVAKWGNSLAIRLPAEYARRAAIKEGDVLSLEEAADGTLTLKPTNHFNRKLFLRRIQRLQAEMPVGESVIEQMRYDHARY